MEDTLSEFPLKKVDTSPSDVAEQAIVLQQKLESFKADLSEWIKRRIGHDCVLEGPFLEKVKGETKFVFKMKFSDGYGALGFDHLISSRQKCSRLSCCASSGEVKVHLTADQFNSLFQIINDDKVDGREVNDVQENASSRLSLVV